MGMVGIILITLVLLGVIVVQIGKLIELSAAIRGEDEARLEANNTTGILLVVFGAIFLFASVYSAWFYKDWMLGYGIGLESASKNGGLLDQAFNITLIFTGIVFILTQAALFFYSWKYRETRTSKAAFIPHDNKLEVIWTVIPAVVMTFLVVNGLNSWNTVMADVLEDDVPVQMPTNDNEYIEFEANGYQWAWQLRYPGADGLLGETYYRDIDPANNPFGQNWEDPKSMDDFYPSDIVLPVNKKVRVRITARDVLHNFFLPHFRLKMDAVPGMPTYFVFTPTITTEQYRMKLKDNPNYQLPSDPKDPESKPRWEVFDFELACAELCGRGHYSMKKIVKIVTESEYKAWLKEQKPYYETNVKGKDFDPFLGTHTEEATSDASGKTETQDTTVTTTDAH